MYDETEALHREEECSYENRHPLPPKCREEAGYVKEESEGVRDIYESISLHQENEEPKGEAEPPGQDLKAVTSINTVSDQSTCLPTQWKSCWGYTMAVLLAIVGACLLINIILLSQHAATFSKLTKLNTSSAQGTCKATSIIINELTTVFVNKLKTLEKQIDAQKQATNNKVEEQISRIEGKLNKLGNQIDTLCCPDPLCWQEFQGSYYYFSGSAKTWGNATNVCVTHNSYLIIIDSKQEQDFVVSKMTAPVIWLGLNDVLENGRQWRWVDGSPLGKSFWKKGEPNNIGGREDCATLLKEGNWNDVVCEIDVHFVCEKTVNCMQ